MGSDDLRGGTEINASVALRPLVAVPKLSAIAGPGAGRGLALVKSFATVGRHATNDLVLADPRVSGVHLEVRRVSEGVHVRDAGSTNGTWLGPHRVTDVELAVGGTLVVGGTTIRIDADEVATIATASDAFCFGGLVGQSQVMREVFATLERVASKNLGVLVRGETGTGKEEAARAIHAHSPRAGRPFIVIDTTALPETLAESLLFGHEKGAFTGADQLHTGYFEAASGGTVLIDEVGELPAPLQPKFLRALEHQEVVRVGSNAPTKIDVRVVAATHRDLRHEVEAGRFREDLYFRLAQFHVEMPPLRERMEDIPLLCRQLLTQIQGDRETPLLIEQGALDFLTYQPWPGNVRELRNVLARAAALAPDGIIRRADVAGEGFGFRGTPGERSALDLGGTFTRAKAQAVDHFESAYLTALMRRCAGNLSKASREADVQRHHLRDVLKRHGLYGLSWAEETEEE